MKDTYDNTEKEQTVVGLGPDGTYSHMALNKVIQEGSGLGIHLKKVPEALIKEVRAMSGSIMSGLMGNMAVMEAIPHHLAGAIPMHNTYGGTVNLAPEGLLQLVNSKNAEILGWHSLKIIHVLAGLPGTQREEVISIHSHPQALAQCEGEGIQRLMDDGYTPDKVNEQSTTSHIPELKDGEAVICNSLAAQLNNLDIIESGFGPIENQTEFAIVSVHGHVHGLHNLHKNKALLILDLPDGRRAMANGTGIISDAGIDMSSIHSQPQGGETRFIVLTRNSVDWNSLKQDISQAGGQLRVL